MTSAISRGSGVRPWLVMGLAALCSSATPPIIEWTSPTGDPFLLNSVVYVVQLCWVAVFMWSVRGRWLRLDSKDARRKLPRELLSPSTHFAYRPPVKESDSTQSLCAYRTAAASRPATWMRLPVLWALIASLPWALLIWATRFVETAVATTIFQLWPVVTVYGLARYNSYSDAWARRERRSSGQTREHIVLSALAGIGIVFVMGGQAGIDPTAALGGLWSPGAIFGLMLSAAASTLLGLSLVTTIAYGNTIYCRVFAGGRVLSGEELKQHDVRPQLWCMMLAYAVPRLVSIPLGLIVGLLVSGSLVLPGRSLLAVAALGSFQAIVITLLRLANLMKTGPGVNALMYVAPVLGLGWLAWFTDIELLRSDLFAQGAFLIFALNVIIQMHPDAERDYTRFSVEAPRGVRLGFTSFILSLWGFGALVYLRDEWMGDSALYWASNDYWTLVGLSATIFALILGFRLARLTSRIAHEDAITLELLRDCEQLINAGVVTPDTVAALSKLDTAGNKELLGAYNDFRDIITGARRKAFISSSDSKTLISVEKKLDAIAHSKQLGRDVVELISLTGFAAITIAIGVLARPINPATVDEAWSGWLVEMFTIVFVATIAFLCTNLFDIRRERESPLFVAVKERDDEYGVLMRYRRERAVGRNVAVLICLSMVALYGVLLHQKWL